jgi:hypothetical protein
MIGVVVHGDSANYRITLFGVAEIVGEVDESDISTIRV